MPDCNVRPMYEEEDGALAVKLARASIDRAVKGAPFPDIHIPKKFLQDSGAFVTLSTYPKHELRGCIGYPEPHFPLKDSLIRGAEGATNDPRFPPLDEDELDKIIVEVSLLSPPKHIKIRNPKELLKLAVFVGIMLLAVFHNRIVLTKRFFERAVCAAIYYYIANKIK